MRNTTRNLIGFALAGALYFTCLYLLYLLQPKGAQALLLLAAFHVGFGISGYFLFVGGTLLRAACVFLVVIGFGIGSELVRPDPKHELVQVFVGAAFGVVAAIATSACGLLAGFSLRNRLAGRE